MEVIQLRNYQRTYRMSYEAINFREKFALFDEQWKPRIIAEMNDYQFKVVKLGGDFIWHDHKETDETFTVLEGDLRNRFSRWCRPCLGRRDVRRAEGRPAQAV